MCIAQGGQPYSHGERPVTFGQGAHDIRTGGCQLVVDLVGRRDDALAARGSNAASHPANHMTGLFIVKGLQGGVSTRRTRQGRKMDREHTILWAE